MILLSCAKTMNSKPVQNETAGTTPRFAREAHELALALARRSPDELRRLLRVPAKIAAENFNRYQAFHSPDTPSRPAIDAYTGIVFKTLLRGGFDTADRAYAQERLRITSFLYGLLRPLDGIKPYRAEGDMALPDWGGLSLFDYWKPRLTSLFEQEIEASGGVLFNLASDEMRRLFDWKRLEERTHIITPQFQIRHNDGWKTVVVYTKMARGAMARYLLKERIETPHALEAFEWEGFRFDAVRSDNHNYIFTHE